MDEEACLCVLMKFRESVSFVIIIMVKLDIVGEFLLNEAKMLYYTQSKLYLTLWTPWESA